MDYVVNIIENDGLLREQQFKPFLNLSDKYVPYNIKHLLNY